MAEDPKLVVINAAVPAMIGFDKANRAKAGKQFVDVGICEEHAVAFASAIAKGGAKPVYAVVSTFVQRTYDQLSQDLCINDSPATILVTTGTLRGLNDVTHLGWFDIPLLSNIPNLVYLCPTSEREYFAMLDWSIDHQAHPVAIRQPEDGVRENDVEILSDYSGAAKWNVTRRGTGVAIVGLGNFYALGAQLCDALAAKGVSATLVNPRCASALDEATLADLVRDHSLFVTLEDGVIDGGFGEKVARYFALTPNVKTLVRGGAKTFADRYDYDALLAANRLTVPQLVEDVLKESAK
jgi:1-deoxy-D-xylulose-5-phosphate synthase